MICMITMVVLVWLHSTGIRPIVDLANTVTPLFSAGCYEACVELLFFGWMNNRRAK
jgi:hypothetical protein